MNLAEFHFIRPYWFLAVLPYLMILALMVRNKLVRGNWSTVCDAELLPYLLQEKAINQSRWPLISGAIACFLVIVALAGPTWERLPSPVFRNDSAWVIALDLSLSMNAADIKPSRLTMARYKISDILKRRKDGQTALLVYAGDAFTVTPLTNDTETIDSQLSALNTDIMPSQGSNAALVLEKAVDLFKQAGLQKGRILLVTDGVDVDKTLSVVKSLGNYPLSILGVGTDDGAPIALPEGGFLKDGQGTIVVPKLNSSELTMLAQAGKGVYQTMTSNDADIQTLLANLDNAEQQSDEKDNLLVDQWSEKGPWLLMLAAPLAALTFRKGLLLIVLMLPLPRNSYALDWQGLWQSKNQQAQQSFQRQDYAKAAEQFENPDWKAAAYYKAGDYNKALESLKNSQSPSSPYNYGNALAQSGQLEEAIKAYQKVLDFNPEDADALHNKEVVEKELEKQKKQQKDGKQQSKGDSQQNKDDKPSDKSEGQKKSEEKPEQKQEQKASEQQNAEGQDKDDGKKPEDQKPQQAEQDKDADKQPEKGPAPVKAEPTNEQQQANEQWLKRIPDDPSGLLKRKFKYQYGQRGGQANQGADQW